MSPSDDPNLPEKLWVNLCTAELVGLHRIFLEPAEGPLPLADAIEWAEAIWQDARGVLGPKPAALTAVVEILHLSGLEGLPPS